MCHEEGQEPDLTATYLYIYISIQSFAMPASKLLYVKLLIGRPMGARVL